MGSSDLTEQQLRDRVSELAPFHHAIELPYGVSTYIPELAQREVERTRVSNMLRHCWPALLSACGQSLRGKRVLDVACNCGGFSVEAVKSGARDVLGIDIVDRYLEQANLVKEALGYENLSFRKLGIENLDAAAVGIFDVALCFGILYHLEDPVGSMKRLSSITTSVLVVDTQLFRPRLPVLRLVRKAHRALWFMSTPGPPREGGTSTDLWRTDKTCQFLPTAEAVTDLMRYLGFSKVTQLQPTKGLKGPEGRQYKGGRRATFIGVRSSAE